MATYNGSRFVRRQLETILPQLGPEDELIVSDDASSDGTAEIVRAVCGPRVRLLHGSFRSPVLNFEHALAAAQGQVIVLADQDDVWCGNKLARVRAQFAGHLGERRLVLFDGTVIDEEEHLLHPSIFALKGSRSGFLRNLYDSSYLGCCLAFSRELLQVALPFPRNILMHDMWIAMLAELCGTVELDATVTIGYRKHAGSTTTFARRFEPLRQVSERAHMAYCLLVRMAELKYHGRI
jgi:glycosyltransferase involved in cell wall biosynthesis